MKYFEVAPLVYIGQETSVLTYSGADICKPGMAVKINLRNKIITGVITREVNKPAFKTKEITGAIYNQPILSSEMLELTKWMSEYYAASFVSVLQTMIPSGIDKKRRKIAGEEKVFDLEEPLNFTTDQKKVYDSIKNNLNNKPHLIFGVTGSGKTEIYLQLIDDVRKRGQQAIMLVPEISLTPQTISRFEKRFGNDVTVLHSYLKETERFANWKAVVDGEKNVIIGSRSALFAPCQKLGLIVIDEEHETSYKQDKTPRYNTYDVAKKLSKLNSSGLIVGSATPKLTTFYEAEKGNTFLHTLSNRIVQTNLPKVEIVDMRHEFKYGNMSILSERLQQEISETVGTGKQVMLFLNRRGMSTFVSCRECGHVEMCPKCESSLTFHYKSLILQCHHCNYQKAAPISCPECKSPAIKYFGTGTQRIEEEVKKIFKNKYSVVRMDADTTKTTGSHEEIFEDFSNRKFDILIGTQMITKGWDLPNVGLVGVISADTSINFPDYTASERTFDLLTQVAGRTGRGLADAGKVVIQTYNPEHFAIRYAAKHDYKGFYTKELENRQELDYPPFAKLIKLLYNNEDKSTGETTSLDMAKELKETLKNYDVTFLGPSPAFIPRMNNKYYFQLTLKIKAATEKEFIEISKILQKITNNNWSIDIDPADLL